MVRMLRNGLRQVEQLALVAQPVARRNGSGGGACSTPFFPSITDHAKMLKISRRIVMDLADRSQRRKTSMIFVVAK